MACITNTTTAPAASPADEIGVRWWNALSESDRKKWMARAGNTGIVADAWEAYVNRRPDAAEIIQMIRSGIVPVNAELSEAIAAHKAAAASADQSGRDEDKEVAADALYAVVLSTPGGRAGNESRYAYLAAQPVEAWSYDMGDMTPAALREATLAMLQPDLDEAEALS